MPPFPVITKHPPSVRPIVPPSRFSFQIYKAFPETVTVVFGPNGENPPPSSLTPSARSFKVVTECPLIVMFLFQLYLRYAAANIPTLLPLMLRCIALSGPASVDPRMRAVYADFKAAQIKVGGVDRGVVWRGLVWCGVAWCGLVWRNVVRDGVMPDGAARCNVVL